MSNFSASSSIHHHTFTPSIQSLRKYSQAYPFYEDVDGDGGDDDAVAIMYANVLYDESDYLRDESKVHKVHMAQREDKEVNLHILVRILLKEMVELKELLDY